ncbi:ISWI chromatin-remodeling complex ATPase ISW2 [Smittium mucronatum]|uniref:ISWI chromatin-remodeling complex ATPase ISW2 n=1 Tax=Smittium mucronatum TaxID=133383 RepID=A0A1R0GQR0_9FUNG|nr:ISWI chromatin-remodeling complex ATPase ISW2 [Smittium mucronatum]
MDHQASDDQVILHDSKTIHNGNDIPSKKKEKPIDKRARRFAYLLGQTEIFSHFLKIDDMDLELQNEVKTLLQNNKIQKSTNDLSRRHRKSEKAEDAELIKAGVSALKNPFMFSTTPPYVKGGTMREYQIRGLNWMIGLYDNALNGILADEMGLGKTLQTISFLGYLKHYCDIPGPFLIVVPKTTLHNWKSEFAKWVPTIVPIMLHGDKEARKKIFDEGFHKKDIGCVITTYEMCLLCKSQLSKINWKYIIIDEAHRIKNEKSSLSIIMRSLKSENRLLITGTPLQNNLHELWALLNFLLPDVFNSSEVFDDFFMGKKSRSIELKPTSSEPSENHNSENLSNKILDPNSTINSDDKPNAMVANKKTDNLDSEVKFNIDAKPGIDDKPKANAQLDNEEDKDETVHQLQRVLQPFLLRRIKSEVEKSILPKKEINVYVGLTQMQKIWYKRILEKDLDAINGIVGKKEGKMRLLNIVMQLRKCCNHPYLFNGAEPGPPYTTDEHLVANSGKMLVLDKLLKQKKQDGSRVLIFSQMSRLLDILEDYCNMRGFEYCRIDGQTSHEDRVEFIDDYNRPGSSKFIFLLTTRAGGLGINLTTADTVIIYDSDWNPQADLQAQDRAHRIGQTKQVYIYRFVTENAVEEKVLEKAMQKLRLDQLVIQKPNQINAANTTQSELLKMVQFGALDIFSDPDSKSSKVSSSVGDKPGDSGAKEIEEAEKKIDLDALLLKSAMKTTEIQSKYSTMSLDELVNFGGESQSYRQQYMEGDTDANLDSVNGSGSSTPSHKSGKDSELRKLPGLGLVNTSLLFIQPAKRERKVNYVVDDYYRELLRNGGTGINGGLNSKSQTENKHPKMPKQPSAFDFQFYPQELYEILLKERNYYSQFENEENGHPKSKKAKIEHNLNPDENEAPSDTDKLKFSDEDVVLKNSLIEKYITNNDGSGKYGFPTWTKREFSFLIRLFEKFGNKCLTEVYDKFEDKEPAEVKLYLSVFMKKYPICLEDPERVNLAILKGNSRREQVSQSRQLLDFFYSKICTGFKGKMDPFNYEEYLMFLDANFAMKANAFRLNYSLHKTINRLFSETEDLFLLFCMQQLDLASDNLYSEIKRMIKSSEVFRFNFYIKTRTVAEIQKRCHSLLILLGKQFNV